ncbi:MULTISPECIES: cell division protein FtsA [Desulfovibrionaceae]|jgi:cell division protein FtsA|uniref:Cell division protein FtsA n=2 Tax=Solidesulfovibrio magneticus TaxID=184917 RepID=C4XK65_SOLM1|nr:MULTISPECIES: cell division protein FtsA [Desulfovibrionaceae]EKO37827.1 MAG: cell division protein FtsA [Solidesulfovibrio magneticus str. Maddingley MBC34]HML52610.1 cell division protein FtsA [Solidesulfovibrio magneticus]HML61961.1 cell division protein FtsA [Solidesulfovibrio sp.]KHK03433.1 Cell division protein FtsA [Desulfovibrio sp. TomC]BAH76814.1 cell division protein FtsA [Solidesulfovibrio magneticus RS-1]
MARSELIVGLDIGTTKICVVVGELSPEGVDVVGIGTSPSTGLRKGVVVNIEQTVQSIKKALEEAELMAGCEIRSVYAGIAGSHIKGFNSHGVIAVKGGEVGPRDIERVIDAAKAVAIPLDREVIHILPQEFIVDDQRGIADPLGMAGVRLEVRVHIVTGAVTSAQNIIRSCHRAGLDVSDIVLESLASSKAVLTGEEREIGVALVDLGGGTTDLAIFANDSIKHTAVLALGGTNLTNDIAFGLRTPMASAEKIKIKYGCALAEMVPKDEVIEVMSVGGREPRRLSRQVLAEICEPRVEEMLALVDQELIRSGMKNQIGAGVVLTGGTALIEGIQELGEQIFNLPTRIGYPDKVGGLKDVVNSPMYATAVGLLMYGAEKEGVEQRFRIRDENVFNRILGRMRKWFVDVK